MRKSLNFRSFSVGFSSSSNAPKILKIQSVVTESERKNALRSCFRLEQLKLESADFRCQKLPSLWELLEPLNYDASVETYTAQTGLSLVSDFWLPSQLDNLLEHSSEQSTRSYLSGLNETYATKNYFRFQVLPDLKCTPSYVKSYYTNAVLDEFKHTPAYIKNAVLNEFTTSKAPYIRARQDMLKFFQDLESCCCSREQYQAPAQTRYCENAISYYYKKPGYTIGPEDVEADGGNFSGSGYDDNGGGSGWGGSDDGGSNWNNNNYVILFLFGSGVIVIGRVIGDYGYKILSFASDKYLQVTQNQLDQAREPENAGIEPGRSKSRLFRAIKSTSVYQILLTASAISILSYVLNPERLRDIFELLADAIVILAQELGRVLLQLIPPQFHELAHRVGQAIEYMAFYTRQILEQVVIPVLLYARTFAIWFISAFLVFKLVSLGAEIYQAFSASGIAQNVEVPPEVTAKALEVADRIGAITAADSPALFLNQFIKAVSLLLLGLVPAPEFGTKVPKSLVRFGHLAAIFGVYSLVLQDTRHITQLASSALQASPELNSMVSCIAGRFCLIIITGNLVRRESALKNLSLPFFCMLYVLRVYQLAFSASPNFLLIN
uniref:Uncharacterized protein n=1 Tax=Halimeda micronesica TaxID=170426 RepID=A0A386AXB1_9CHLO|nr:hypothetical protein [Halimeda micronesica]